MKPARLVVLDIALAAGLGAAGQQTVVVAAPPPPPLTDKALVAARALNSGDVIDESGMRW
jgi:hypothetical protein